MNPSPLLRRCLSALLAVVLACASAAAAVEKYSGGPIVAELVSRLLEQTHYARKPIDDAVAKQFLRNCLDSFDYNHMLLQKSDIDEFEAKYATTLDDRVKDGDVEPAYEIYDRVVKRLEERVALVKRLSAGDFTYDIDEAVILDRHEAAWPATSKDAEEIWRQRIKHEFLLEHLTRLKAAESKAVAPAKKDEKPAKEATIKETVDTRYDRTLRSYREYDGADILQIYLSALAHVFDPHTDYLAAAQKENFDIQMKLSLVGIGAVLRSEDGYAKILSLVPGGPADTDKRLKAGDRVEAVAQGDGPFVEVVGMKLDRVVSMIRGEKGTTVRMRVLPVDALDPSVRAVVTLVRDEIKLTDQEARARLYTLTRAGGRAVKIGMLDLPSFYADMRGGEGAKSVTHDTARLLAELKKRGIDAVVVDLRHDGGGSLAEAVSLSGLFIKNGPIVQVRDARGSSRVLSDTEEGVAYEGPLVVLTSRASASAAEIFPAAMQDYGRGLIVGDKSTFGKGTVQSVLELNQYLPPAYRSYKPGALKLTVQKFYRISGGSTQHRGVLPDIHLPSAGDLSESTESSQKNALPYDEIEPAPYVRIGATDGRRAPLAKASAERVASSREFQWIREDLERWEKQKADKTLSLNERKRLAERKADEDRQTARKKERIASKRKPLAFEEITLAMLDGKTPPVAASTAPARGAAPRAEEDEEDFERAPDAPDAVLEESLRIADDLVAGTAPDDAHAFTPGGEKTLAQ
ncbi:MAG: carboxy terminal-processing peptidase [Elusimicrobiota bacterium]